ncbi:hypothetical protein SAMN04488096_10525 [Mesonia phycicola]|uniref:Uncharacterized protein n=1 Tax=Mesonia phycicola TaxID=579105 RepID=A0A1M6ECW0_9FLAO|nr:hypothetical protein [Mesonia phycicola]SHI83304.1 hypothetical protein SAMN04488096_10525 [Mesonia phycicola]
MKKYLLYILITIIAVSCNLDDNDTEYLSYELVPVNNVNIPDTLDYGEQYDFEISYIKPSTCHTFSGFDYNQEGNTRVIAVVNSVYFDENTDCTTLEEEIESETLPFEVLREDNYIFKFWQGIDDVGEYIYLIKEIPVRVN